MERENSNKQTIAYIVICHDQPELLSRLGEKLAYNDDKIFVHVDNKVDITPFKKATDSLNNVQLIEKRIDNYWGGVQFYNSNYGIDKSSFK